jgi:small-conductance mechanosensitive channel
MEDLVDVNVEAMLYQVLRVGGILVGGWVGAQVSARTLKRVFDKRLDAQRLMLLSKAVFYFIILLTLIYGLGAAGVNLKVVIGAAGLLTVAIGFAAQTSISNLISGLFLVTESPFVVGDIVDVDGLMGVILSVDLMSTRIRRFDNVMVRIPNELVMKSKLMNYTRHPLRRVDLRFTFSYQTDIKKLRDLFMEIADKNPLCLEEPQPLFVLDRFADSGIEIQFSPWGKTENFLLLKNSIHEEIKLGLEAAKMEIALPHRALLFKNPMDRFTEPRP